MGVNPPVTYPHEEKDMSTTDNRLVGIVGIQVESASYEDSGENVTGGRYALACLSPDGKNVVEFSRGQLLILPSLSINRDAFRLTQLRMIIHRTPTAPC
jgi:hypothetical protein